MRARARVEKEAARDAKPAVNRMRLSPRRARRRLGRIAHRLATAAGLLGLGAVLTTCQSTPVKQAADRTAVETTDEGNFSRDRAWRHLLALTDIGPRVAGTEGAARARAYIREQLEELGLEVLERRSEVLVDSGERAVELVHLTSVIAGESSDVFMLAAPYDTHPFESFEFLGANDGASGPALLLELGRVLVANPLPYTVALTFLDGEALPEAAGNHEASLLGSRELVRQLEEEGSLSTLRLAVFFNQVADSELEIARDLRSHRMYREIFWQAAQSLGHRAAFPMDRGLGSPALAHLSFLDHGVRRVVAIVDDRFGGEYPPGSYWRTERDTPDRCSAQSLEVVATVTLEALERIGARLRKIDHFAHSPFDQPGPETLERSAESPEQAGIEEKDLEVETPGQMEPAHTDPAPPASP